MAIQFVLISARDDDAKYFRALAKNAGWKMHWVTNPELLRTLLAEELPDAIFWDLDGPAAQIPYFARELQEFGATDRTFALSALPLNEHAEVPEPIPFRHYLVRKSDAKSATVYGQLFRMFFTHDPAGIGQFLARDESASEIKTVKIGNAQEKRAAVEAIFNVFSRRELPRRLVTTLTAAVDELILNAVFDAPRDAAGKAYRHAQDRAAPFTLTTQERIAVEIASSDTFIVVGITDPFGSIDQRRIVPLLQKNYREEDFAGHAGLGLQSVLSAGLSLYFVIHPGRLTQATLVIPVTPTIRDFRQAFQFFSFIQR